jgi:hypothetical protein
MSFLCNFWSVNERIFIHLTNHAGFRALQYQGPHQYFWSTTSVSNICFIFDIGFKHLIFFQDLKLLLVWYLILSKSVNFDVLKMHWIISHAAILVHFSYDIEIFFRFTLCIAISLQLYNLLFSALTLRHVLLHSLKYS